MARRDEAAARAAYELADVEASRDTHSVSDAPSVESHKAASGYMKSFVFGGLDGIITTFAVVAGASGGDFSTEVILALGLSSLFADALSMGVGDALSSKSEMEAALKEKDREGWEYDNYLEGEIKEMVEIYEAKGVSREDARLVITTLAKYKDVFVDLMLKDELGLDVPDEDDNPWVDGMVTFGAFVCFGFIPLVAYIALAPLALDSHVLFLVACVLTAVTLFALGAIKSSVTERSWLMSGSETLSLGGAVAAVSYLIGWAVEGSL